MFNEFNINSLCDCRHKCDCRQLPASDCKLYDIHGMVWYGMVYWSL